MLHIAVIGTGYVGLVSGACLAKLGHQVTCVDVVPEKITALNQGIIPIYEEGLEGLVKEETGRHLHFTLSFEEALKKADIVILAVGTPMNPLNGSADLSYLFDAAERIAKSLDHAAVIVTKSTVPVGTGEKIARIFQDSAPKLGCTIASNPEFLREGVAVHDFMEPDRIVIGTNNAKAEQTLKFMYKPLTDKGIPLVSVSIETAELIKYASNAYLATKIALINEIANIAEKSGDDVRAIAKTVGSNPAVGAQFLKAGPGYGGSCFPKDTVALIHIASNVGATLRIVEAVVASNAARTGRMITKIRDAVAGHLEGKRIALLGLAFKGGTDDIRESPAMAILHKLLEYHHVTIQAYDPVALIPAQKVVTKPTVQWCFSLEEALHSADVAVVATEWEEFATAPWDTLAKSMKRPVIVDLRNMVPDPEIAGSYQLHAIGRSSNVKPKLDASLAEDAASAFMIMKATFANEIAELCSYVGADSKGVCEAMGLDHRITPDLLGEMKENISKEWMNAMERIVAKAANYAVPSRILEAVVMANQTYMQNQQATKAAACSNYL